jgi:hypothetical protein
MERKDKGVTGTQSQLLGKKERKRLGRGMVVLYRVGHARRCMADSPPGAPRGDPSRPNRDISFSLGLCLCFVSWSLDITLILFPFRSPLTARRIKQRPSQSAPPFFSKMADSQPRAQEEKIAKPLHQQTSTHRQAAAPIGPLSLPLRRPLARVCFGGALAKGARRADRLFLRLAERDSRGVLGLSVPRAGSGMGVISFRAHPPLCSLGSYFFFFPNGVAAGNATSYPIRPRHASPARGRCFETGSPRSVKFFRFAPGAFQPPLSPIYCVPNFLLSSRLRVIASPRGRYAGRARK